MNYCPADLRSFLAQCSDQVLHINKAVDPATQVAALCSETVRPTLFENITGFPDFKIADCLTRFRDTQALALGIEGGPGDVIPGYAAMLARGPGAVLEVDDAPIKEVIWKGEEARLSRLPIPIPSEGHSFEHLNIDKQDFLLPTISGGMGVTRSPEGQLNTFFTMAKVVDDQRIHFFMLPGHTARNVQALSLIHI